MLTGKALDRKEKEILLGELFQTSYKKYGRCRKNYSHKDKLKRSRTPTRQIVQKVEKKNLIEIL